MERQTPLNFGNVFVRTHSHTRLTCKTVLNRMRNRKKKPATRVTNSRVEANERSHSEPHFMCCVIYLTFFGKQTPKTQYIEHFWQPTVDFKCMGQILCKLSEQKLFAILSSMYRYTAEFYIISGLLQASELNECKTTVFYLVLPPMTAYFFFRFCSVNFFPNKNITRSQQKCAFHSFQRLPLHLALTHALGFCGCK